MWSSEEHLPQKRSVGKSTELLLEIQSGDRLANLPIVQNMTAIKKMKVDCLNTQILCSPNLSLSPRPILSCSFSAFEDVL